MAGAKLAKKSRISYAGWREIGRLAVVVTFLLGVGFLGYVFWSIHVGKIGLRSGTYTRKREPSAFWTGVALWTLFSGIAIFASIMSWTHGH